MDYRKIISGKLRRLKRERKLSLSQISEGAKISPPNISKYLNGSKEPLVSTWFRLLVGLRSSLQDFVEAKPLERDGRAAARRRRKAIGKKLSDAEAAEPQHPHDSDTDEPTPRTPPDQEQCESEDLVEGEQ